MQDKDINDVKLSNSVTVAQYRAWEKEKNKKKFAEFVRDRFQERYLIPIYSLPKEIKNGFSIMANCCLMIETLESFYKGWPKTDGKSELVFCEFFDRANELSDFRGFSSKFYKNVRCGILHQAETTGGWRIHRKGSLFDSESLTINATKFLTVLNAHLEGYTAELTRSEWDSEIWRNLCKKMNAIINNCRRA